MNGRGIGVVSALGVATLLRISLALAQTAPSPSPAASGAPGLSSLTPAQQAALQAYIVKATQNPVGNIAVVPFQNNFNYGVGPYARYQYNLNVQPVVPFMLSKDLTLVGRIIMPVLAQPSFAPPQACGTPAGCGSTFGIGDFNPQLYFAPKTKPGALIWGAGPQFQVPTASPNTLGSGKWSAGPTVVGLIMPGPWVVGVLANQLWSFAGQASRPGVNAFLVQPFANYNFSNGWSLSSAPTITANWNATQDRWTVPLGGGVTKTFKLGDQPMQLGMYYFTYVARPISAPQTQLRINWSLVYPIRRGLDLQAIVKEASKE